MITQKVRLIEGVVVDKVRHRDVIMRLPGVKDSLDALRESDGKGALYMSCVLLARCIIKFGTLQESQFTAELIAELNEVDFERLNEVRDFLKKKASWEEPPLNLSEPE